MARRVSALVLGLALSVGPAAAESCFRGINLSGAEFGEPDGLPGHAYTYPSEQTISYFAEKGFTSIRLPFQWERLQPELFGELNPEELLRIDETLVTFRQYGLSMILDPHNYGGYRGNLIGTDAVPHAAFADFWGKVAAHYANAKDVTFGLMNEPHEAPAPQWLESANAAIAAIREADASNLILVPGTIWSGAHSWEREIPGGSNAKVMLGVVDPARNFAYEVHQYFDDDFSGTKGNCSRTTDAVDAIRQFTDWLKENGQRGYLGEFGVPGEPDCVAALKDMVGIVEENRTLWVGWGYWVAGDWWGESEPLNIQPTPKGDRAQLAGLTPYLNDSSATGKTCPALEGR